MCTVYIKHDSVLAHAVIKVNGQDLPVDSRYLLGDRTINDWVKFLPEMLIKEWSTREAVVEFDGDDVVYKVIEEVVNNANQGGFRLTCKKLEVQSEYKGSITLESKIKKVMGRSDLREEEVNEITKVLEYVKDIDGIKEKINNMMKRKQLLLNDLVEKRNEVLNQSVELITVDGLVDIESQIVQVKDVMKNLGELKGRIENFDL